MFGLMRKSGCDHTRNTINWRANHYCGTCKTMGVEYGQRSRVFLNYDLVFLSELLLQLNPEKAIYDDKAFVSGNCFRLPEEENIPEHLQFVAAVGVLYANIKIQDNLLDNGNPLWRLTDYFFNKPASKSRKQLATWGIDTGLIDFWLRDQQKRETQEAGTNFDHYSEPTAEVTAHIFKTAAIFIDNPGAAPAMEKLGRSFGKIVYWLDACEDFKKDKKKKDFNGLEVLLGPYPDKGQIREFEKYLNAITDVASEQFYNLPIPRDDAEHFAARLQSNLFVRTQAAFHKIEKEVADFQFALDNSWFEQWLFKWRRRWQEAKSLAEMFHLVNKRAQYYSLAVMVFIIPRLRDTYPFAEIVYKKKKSDCNCNCDSCGDSCCSGESCTCGDGTNNDACCQVNCCSESNEEANACLIVLSILGCLCGLGFCYLIIKLANKKSPLPTDGDSESGRKRSNTNRKNNKDTGNKVDGA